MKKLIFVAIIAFGFYNWYTNKNSEPTGRYATTKDELIMYSLTTCGYCKQKVKELRAEGIPFTEYFIDKDKERKTELTSKLEKAGLPPQRFGTPIFDVRGMMLPNNPPLTTIKKYLLDT